MGWEDVVEEADVGLLFLFFFLSSFLGRDDDDGVDVVQRSLLLELAAALSPFFSEI